jgi:ferredoxin
LGAVTERLSRRNLFERLTGGGGTGTEPDAQGPGHFSLEKFYASRPPPQQTIPAFSVRATASDATTKVRGPDLAAHPPWVSRPPAGQAPRLDGVPRVRPHTCLAFTSICSVCAERCPEPGAIVVEQGRPRVVEQACTGCGECIRVCPAPVNGFQIVPRGEPGGRRA